MSLREICKCGHDKTTHHEGKFNCLGMYCNDCKTYRDQNEKTPSTIPPPPDSEPEWADALNIRLPNISFPFRIP